MNISREELYDVLMDIKNKIKEEEKMKQFVISVGDYLNVQTPYSTIIYHYDNIDNCIDDLKYCLECEVKKNEKKSNEKK